MRGALCALWMLTALAPLASAQTEPAPLAADPAKPVLTPPSLKKAVEPVYPREALEEGLTGRVEVEVVIGPDGLVQEASVPEPIGHGFDEAALAAAKQLVFEPARKNGEAISARIRYPFVFEMTREEEPAPEPEAPPPPAGLEGQVLAIEDDEPMVGARVTLTSADGATTVTGVTDDKGHFRIEGLPAGAYGVRIEREGRQPRAQQEELVSGEVNTVLYRLLEPRDPDAFGAIARIAPPPREVTRRTIGKEQLTRIPGTRGDALRTVELMPGVARPPLGTGQLIVRGSQPNDTQAQLEGLPVVLLYHFGGLTSFINSRLLESVEFYPGNFSARYGRRRGGIVDVRAADLPRDKFHGVLDLSLIDASALAQAPVTEDFEVAVAGRRSHFHTLFGAALESADISTVAAPVYYDYQAIASYRPSDRDKLRLMVYGSSDELQLLFEEPADADVSVSGDFDFGTQFHRAHGSWRHRMSADVDQDIDLAVGYTSIDLGFGEAFKFNLSGYDMYGRSEWRGRVSDAVRLIGGLDIVYWPGEYLYEGPSATQAEGSPENNAAGSAFSNRDRVTARDEFTIIQPAVYVESELSLPPLRVVLGSRVDYYDEIEEYSFDPRTSAQLTVTDSTTLKGGIGLYTQPPQYYEASPGLGNPELEPMPSLHVSTGVEQKLAEGYSVGIEGFYKHLYDNVVGTQFGEAPFFTNDGEGRIYGLELLAKIEPRGRFFGYVSYTLSRSERNDRGEGWRLFDFDQPHIVTAAGVYRLGRGWELGALFRLVSGNTDTPVTGSSLNTVTGQYSPLFGRTNSIRNPAFHRLDVRIEKQWTLDWAKIALYLDVQNAYNAENSEGTVYDYEYRTKETIIGLPILPILGLRGEI